MDKITGEERHFKMCQFNAYCKFLRSNDPEITEETLFEIAYECIFGEDPNNSPALPTAPVRPRRIRRARSRSSSASWSSRSPSPPPSRRAEERARSPSWSPSNEKQRRRIRKVSKRQVQPKTRPVPKKRSRSSSPPQIRRSAQPQFNLNSDPPGYVREQPAFNLPTLSQVSDEVSHRPERLIRKKKSKPIAADTSDCEVDLNVEWIWFCFFQKNKTIGFAISKNRTCENYLWFFVGKRERQMNKA